MGNIKRKCAVCGKSYNFCPNCEKNWQNPQPSWKLMFCEKNCMDIFEILSAFSCKTLSADESMEKLSLCDLSDSNNFRDDCKKVLAKINQSLQNG